jgi:hypothetical protein
VYNSDEKIESFELFLIAACDAIERSEKNCASTLQHTGTLESLLPVLVVGTDSAVLAVSLSDMSDFVAECS